MGLQSLMVLGGMLADRIAGLMAQPNQNNEYALQIIQYQERQNDQRLREQHRHEQRLHEQDTIKQVAKVKEKEIESKDREGERNHEMDKLELEEKRKAREANDVRETRRDKFQFAHKIFKLVLVFFSFYLLCWTITATLGSLSKIEINYLPGNKWSELESFNSWGPANHLEVQSQKMLPGRNSRVSEKYGLESKNKKRLELGERKQNSKPKKSKSVRQKKKIEL